MSEPTIVEQAAALKSELATIRADLDKAKQDATAAQALADEAGKNVEAKAAEITNLKDALAGQQAATTAAGSERDAAKAELAKVSAELAELKAKVADNPAFAHASAGRPALKIEAQHRSKTLSIQEFNALSAAEKSAFSINGGKIV